MKAALQHLRTVLRTNHQDSWLAEFLKAAPSPKANALLEEALAANRRGDLDSAIEASESAKRLFKKVGNNPGVVRSQFEHLYALRRSSQGVRCADESNALFSALEHSNFSWLRTQVLIERSSCLAMIDHLDDAWAASLRARDSAARAHYPSLQLRAIAMEAALHANEGRLEQAWAATENGLGFFLNQSFPPERGFQFYSELEFSAEESDQWHLAALLQQEAIAYISSIGRLDFEATAHFHLAAVEESLGESKIARDEVSIAQSLLNRMSHLPPI